MIRIIKNWNWLTSTFVSRIFDTFFIHIEIKLELFEWWTIQYNYANKTIFYYFLPCSAPADTYFLSFLHYPVLLTLFQRCWSQTWIVAFNNLIHVMAGMNTLSCFDIEKSVASIRWTTNIFIASIWNAP